MKTFHVGILTNGECSKWKSWPEKVAWIKAFYAPVCDLEIDLLPTYFSNIPVLEQPSMITTFGPNGATDTRGTTLFIAPDWRMKNVGPLVAGYDIGIFQASGLWKQGMPLGICTGPSVIDTYLNSEADHVYLTGQDLGNQVALIIAHEISHALYALLNKHDNTHLYYYSGQFSKVLGDFNFQIEELKDQVIELLRKEIVILQAKLVELQKKTQ